MGVKKRGMFPNSFPKEWLPGDMSFKKRGFVLGGILLIGLIFVALRSRDSTYYDIRQSMDQYEELLRQNKEQILESLKMCRKTCRKSNPDEPIIYAITPTYTRPVQKAELTRLSHTLMLVNNLHWIIVEDSPKKTALVENLLIHTPLNYTHLNAETPEKYKRKGSEPSWKKPRGVEQRNKALRWLRENRNPEDLGVIYFMDDDNTYSLQVFEEMRWTKEVSVWPVAFAGGLLVERAIVSNVTGKVTGWNTLFRPDREFAVDMAGFAVSLRHILTHPQVEFSYDILAGFQETTFLSHLTKRNKLEPKANNCTQVLVWHTRTEAPKLTMEQKLNKGGKYSNIGMEV